MRRLIQRRPSTTVAALALLILSTAAYGPLNCAPGSQPRTVADILVTAGNTKRELRAANRTDPTIGITAQQDYDISDKLAGANRAYKAFIIDELARLAANPDAQPNPDSRKEAIRQLVGSLRGLEDPDVLGIKNAKSKAVWREAIRGLGNIIDGLQVLGGS